MSISPSSMKCPNCEKQTLEIVAAPLGTWERCPTCGGLFIHQDLIAAASQDRAKRVESLEETKLLLLRTERWCRKCLQKLFEGRVRSRGVIFSLCPACQSFWTSFSILRQFEALIEKTVRMQLEIASTAASAPAQETGAPSPSSSTRNLYEDSGLGHFFRAVARLFDRMADNFAKEPGEKSSK